jgi:Fe-S oxidoreductase
MEISDTEIAGYKRYTAACFQGKNPPCTVVCPLKVDVRSIVDKVQKGNFTTAYRLYRNQAVFPHIVSAICRQPCGAVCVKGRVNAAINVRLIERACVELSEDRDPIAYNVPQKKQKIAIIGAGLSGMTCALKLASRRYEVIIYEKQDAPGGALRKLLPEKVYLSDFQNEFKNVSYELETCKEILDLNEIHADAIYVATGAGGETFELREELNYESLGTKRKGVFLGGSLIGANPIEAIEHGVRVSHSIEKYLKVGLMDGAPGTYQKEAICENYYLLPMPAESATEQLREDSPRDEAIREAKQCLKCDCNLCVTHCDLMQMFKKGPQRIIPEVMTSLRPIQGFTKRIASRLIHTCNQCGLCKTVCPENIDMEDCLLQARRALFKTGATPAAFHDFWLRDMEFANSDQAYALIPSAINTKSRYMFFPGCQLGASEPSYVLKAFEFLREICIDTSLLVGCCGVPADWSGNEAMRKEVQNRIYREWRKIGEPITIVACPTCMKMFARYLPEIKVVSLYDVMAQQLPTQCKGRGDGTIVSVFDPCASRYDMGMQKSIRKLLHEAGYKIEELAYHGEEARCCSFGGHIHAVNPEQVNRITANRIRESENPYVTYCSNCRDTFGSEEKACSHILDIIFDIGPPERAAPDLSQRRRNRVALVNKLAGKEIVGSEDGGETKHISIDIPAELRRKMNRQLILEEDVLATIEHCEAMGNTMHNRTTGEFTAHLCNGVITYWVTYEKGESGKKLKQVYSHRMTIDESIK